MCIRDRVTLGSFLYAAEAGAHTARHFVLKRNLTPVSYTHLDVYKRQPKNIAQAAVKFVDKPQRKITEIRIFRCTIYTMHLRLVKERGRSRGGRCV